jgi:hypothetical protein
LWPQDTVLANIDAVIQQTEEAFNKKAPLNLSVGIRL